MQKGISIRAFDAALPLAEAARQASAAGFQVLELFVTGSGPLRIDSDETACRAAGEAIRAAGVQIGALACDLHWDNCFTSSDSQERTRAHELAVALLDRARWAGASVVIVVPGVVGGQDEKAPRVRYGEALARAADALRRLWPEAEARGVRIAVRNACGRFLLSPVEMRELIDHVNSPWIAACFDMGNVRHIGYPQDWIATVARRIACVHVADYRIGAASDGCCPLGEGDVDWPAVLTALKNAGYEGPLVYEGFGDPADVSARMGRILGGA
ncbi:MAG: sugar phosphate isomerase/epimerase family protein [Phycisphaerae bacterium]